MTELLQNITLIAVILVSIIVAGMAVAVAIKIIWELFKEWRREQHGRIH